MHANQDVSLQLWLLRWSWILLACGLILGWPSLPAAQAQEPSPPFDLGQVPVPASLPIGRSGEALFQPNCAPCHGAQGLGDGPTAADLPEPPTAFADPAAVWELSPAELFFTTKYGRLEKLMPPWGNQLSDAQIWQTVAYAWGLHTSPNELANGAILYAESCAACHGEGGAGDGPEADGSEPDFTDLAYAMAYSQADWLAGWLATHPEIESEWDSNQQRSVLQAMRAFTYRPAWESAYRPGAGVIQGEVMQGSAGGGAVDGLDVFLDVFVGFEPTAVFTATTDLDGRFQFGELSTDPGLTYLATVSFGEIEYSSQPINFSPDLSTQQTAVTVYETSDSPAGIVINRVHWIVDSRPGALLVGQILAIGSTADRTFVGTRVDGLDRPATVALAVPATAQEISFQSGALGGRFRQVGNLIYDTAPVAPGPGSRQIIIRYTLPYAGTSYTLEQEYAYPIQDLNLLVGDLPQLQVESPELSFVGNQDMQGQVYQLWQAPSPAPNRLTVRLTGLLAAGAQDPRTLGAAPAGQTGSPQRSGTSAQSSPLPVALGGLLALMLIGAVAWSWQQSRVVAGDPPLALRQQHDRLLQRIARLDDLYALGEIDQMAWQQQRSQLKAQLLTVAGQLADLPRAG